MALCIGRRWGDRGPRLGPPDRGDPFGLCFAYGIFRDIPGDYRELWLVNLTILAVAEMGALALGMLVATAGRRVE